MRQEIAVIRNPIATRARAYLKKKPLKTFEKRKKFAKQNENKNHSDFDAYDFFGHLPK